MTLRFSVWTWGFFVCALVVMVLALMPSPPPMITTGWDKSNHLLAFGVLAWLGCKAFPQHLAFTLLSLLAYGALIEILQSFTPTRSAEWLDLLADAVGILAGWMVVRSWGWVADRRPQ
ncbi:MAG: VanZ family protein [Rhodoferax sp.]|uniref:VanZ family protein n=1 Tax=Rhodoferax sp. TaxID=50421 RepID=UPI00261728E0|nr:VanZ family protein [Rhodoferax sp.]MDD5334879.1 VanZ family protein [Rhodoferax sp.]